MNSENEKNAAEIEADRELFRHLIDGIKDYAIFMIKPDGIIATWNPGVKRLLGYEEQEFVGQPFSLIFTRTDIEQGVPEAELKIAISKDRAEDERWHRKKDGSVFWASGLVTRMFDENNVLRGCTKIMQDQTAKKEFEKQLLDTTHALTLANKELSNFAGILSHDLNTPLQTVYGFANILKEKDSIDSEFEESVNYIVDGTKRMINLVSDLLRFTNAEGSVNELSETDTNAIVHQIISGLNAKIKESQASVICDDLPIVWAHEIHLGRIFQNLIENAIKYSRKDIKPLIHIGARPGKNEVIFYVEDNGIGIEPGAKDKLFILFERVKSNQDIAGKGIGLAVCKKIIKKWGGRIWIEHKNDGTIFCFSIPDLEDMSKPLAPE